jgi:hypothetical protein
VLNLDLILISGAVLMLSILLYRIAAGDMSFQGMNMLSYSFYLLFAFSFVGSIVLTLNVPFLVYDPATYLPVAWDPLVRLKVWLCVMWMFLGIPIGAIIIQSIFKTGSTRHCLEKHRQAPLEVVGLGLSESAVLLAFVMVGSVILFSTVYRLAQTGGIPILNLVATGNIVGTQYLRSQSHLSSGIINILDSIFGVGIIQWMSYVAYIVSAKGGRMAWKLAFIALFMANLMLSLYNTAIAPIFIYLIGFIIIRPMIGKKAIRLHEAGLACGLLIVLCVAFKGVNGGIFRIFEKAVVGRVMISQLVGFYEAMDVFPLKEPFIWFANTGRIFHEWFNLSSKPSYGIITMAYYNPAGVEAGTAGHLTTIFMGEAWANFGYLGVILAPLWVGAVVQMVNLWFLTHRKSAASVGLYAYLATFFAYHADFQSFFYPMGTCLFLLGVASILILAKMFMPEKRLSPPPASAPGRIGG